MQIDHNQSVMDKEMVKISKRHELQNSVIVVLFRGKKLPKYCTPMPRNPKPKINISLDNNFSELYFATLKKNPSIEDGAIFIRIDCKKPILKGFSYRIYPPMLNVSRLNNMGSGYNSSLDFSGVNKIICVYFIHQNTVKKFINGKEKVLF